MGTTKVYGKGKNKKLMGVKAMSELRRSQTLMKSNASLTQSAIMGESMVEDNKLGQTAVNNLGFSAHDIKMGGSQQNFRAKFMEEYGVEIEFPTYYTEDGVIVPHYAGYVISLGFHSIPRNNDQ